MNIGKSIRFKLKIGYLLQIWDMMRSLFIFQFFKIMEINKTRALSPASFISRKFTLYMTIHKTL